MPAQDDVVGLRAGEVLQRRPERLGRHDAQIDLQAAAAAGPTSSSRRGPARRPGRGSAARRSIAAGGVAGDDQEVQIAHRLAAAAVTAGRLPDLPIAGQPSSMWARISLDELVGVGPEDPLVGLGGELQAAEDRRLRSWRRNP